MTERPARRPRIIAVADTDSYVKWAAALVADPWVDGSLIVLDTELVVSDTQLTSALSGTGLATERVRRAAFDELPVRLAGADGVVIAARGPLTRVVARVAAGLNPRPVIVTGLPGISLPATWLALHFRRQCDMFVLHSHREIAAFRALADERGIDQRFALATLPFARHAAQTAPTSSGTDLVFAAQALAPRSREDRIRVARILVDAAHADPSRCVVLKLRGRPGEQQTHREVDAYPDLLAEMDDVPRNLVVSYAPMHEALATAEGLVTVSSTAAIEAAAQGVPVIALDTFGIDEKLINVVFAGSGLLGGADDVVARRFRHPHQDWLRDNYFHDAADDSWVALVADLIVRRRRGDLPGRPAHARVGGLARDAWERRLALGNRDRSLIGVAAYGAGVPLRAAMRRWRRVVTRARGPRSA
ncbi:DUF6716 putative glycosyltransferase [Microbacterium sp. G2-8]|uniref:DUF6716 putative glycosyltransferase n=1 Tax=Microbacterium sp. G2-8 TaxID=2842454 RepID=UPI001C89AB6C|nr:DUF6716 putative glycosyltransferase [Microbacterium sp. G2-8]